jgi:hypothetical protein
MRSTQRERLKEAHSKRHSERHSVRGTLLEALREALGERQARQPFSHQGNRNFERERAHSYSIRIAFPGAR